MNISGLHFLLTYQCTHECDHCFVWGSPRQSGVMSLRSIRSVLEQASATGTIEWIYFEGGEPFLYYPILVEAVGLAAEAGFQVGIVTNGHWASNREDALAWLRPFAGPLLAGGPAELARHRGVLHQAEYADACHLCYETRRELRDRYPEFLGPDMRCMEGSGSRVARGLRRTNTRADLSYKIFFCD